ncbi:TonB-dependent receptor [Mucilaginibacter jinjuensis]|uniref:TonB-dependent receptor n=1 Tax=Mucilaginibacter jinjuensis TaxID=1176721 RepID=A0ABY7T0U4_9SPHI|nr:TonB-dependent receptor [Mucilaginibacter jinjuensis]WCT09939.1 TonB-dependent receptor [Mucilaginibacter jinjuensis]
MEKFTAKFRPVLISRYGIYSICIACMLLLLSTRLKAQQDTSKKLKEVNVTSSTLPKVQTIIPVQQISNADFSHYAALSVADIAANFAGVNVKDYGGIGGLKTISVRSMGATHTGVQYDGVILNDAQNGQIDLGKFSLYNVQSVTLYNGQAPNIVQPARSFASASILDIKTTRPQLSAAKPYQVSLGGNGGSFGLLNPYLQWQQRVSKQWSVVLNANYTYANGQYKYKENGDGSDTLATRRNSDIKALQTDGALYWAKSDSNKFKIQFNYYNSDRGLPGPVIYYTTQSNQRMQNHDLLVQSAYEYIAKSSFHLLLNSKYSQNYLHYLDPSLPDGAIGSNEHYMQHEFYQSASVGYHILHNWEVSYASDAALTNLFSDVYTNYYQYAFPTRLTLFNAVATDLAFDKWHLQGNLLNTYITDHVKNGIAAASKSAFTPSLSATFQPFLNSGLQLRAFYKDIFRNPTFAEQYYYAVRPRNLDPERTKQYDLGITYQKSFNGFVHDLAVTADAYYNNVRNKIIYLPSRSPETPSVTNLGSVDIKGLDVTLKTDVIPAVGWLGTISVNYTYQNAINVTDPSDSYYLDQIPYTPKNLLNLNAGINYKALGLYYNSTFSSSRYYENNNVPEYYLPSYNVSNASLIYKFLTHSVPVNASFEVNNLFNERYVVLYSYPMPGRSYRLSFQITI